MELFGADFLRKMAARHGGKLSSQQLETYREEVLVRWNAICEDGKEGWGHVQNMVLRTMHERVEPAEEEAPKPRGRKKKPAGPPNPFSNFKTIHDSFAKLKDTFSAGGALFSRNSKEVAKAWAKLSDAEKALFQHTSLPNDAATKLAEAAAADTVACVKKKLVKNPDYIAKQKEKYGRNNTKKDETNRDASPKPKRRRAPPKPKGETKAVIPLPEPPKVEPPKPEPAKKSKPAPKRRSKKPEKPATPIPQPMDSTSSGDSSSSSSEDSSD